MVGAVTSKESDTSFVNPMYGVKFGPVKRNDAWLVPPTFQPELRLATAKVMSESVCSSDVR